MGMFAFPASDALNNQFRKPIRIFDPADVSAMINERMMMTMRTFQGRNGDLIEKEVISLLRNNVDRASVKYYH